MAFLPKAMVPRARRYVDHDRMRAADLIVAKAVLAQDGELPGALSVFFEQHLDPARAESEGLREKITELDEIDLEGWLIRILLAEYQRLGEQLHPGEPDAACIQDAEAFARWLYRLAAREPGAAVSLTFQGRYFKVAVIWVAASGRLATEGLRPYRRRARQYLWRDRYDAIYLMARDDNIPAVAALGEELENDARAASVTHYRYRLRADFAMRKLPRDKAILVCVRRRQAPDEQLLEPPEIEAATEAEPELPEEVYDPSDAEAPGPARPSS